MMNSHPPYPSLEDRRYYLDLLEHTEKIGLRMDPEGRILYLNPFGLRFFGYRKEDLIGRTLWETLLPRTEESSAAFRDLAERIASDPARYLHNVNPNVRSDGTLVWIAWSNFPLYRPDGTLEEIISIGSDITDQIRMQRDLTVQKTYFETIFQSSPDAVALLDASDRVMAINRAFTALFQYHPNEAVGRFINDLVAKGGFEEEAQALSRKALQGLPLEVESVRRTKDGSLVDVAIVAKPIHLDGRLIAIYASYRDIRHRKEAERALREMDEKYRLIVDHSNDAVFVVQDGRLRFWNPQFKKITGYDEAAIPNITFDAIIHPDDRQMVLERYRACLKERERTFTCRFRLLSKDDAIVWVHVNLVVAEWDGQPAIINFARDFTREKELEAQLVQSQKMEAVGTLAGGIAHDFNNLLQSIQGYAELLRLNKEENDPDFHRIQRILESVQKGSKLTKQLLTFSRKLESDLKPLDLNNEILQIKGLLTRTIPKMITIQLDLDPHLPYISADTAQISQLIMNLAVNAKDAMPEGGVMTLATRGVGPKDSLPPSLPPGEYARLTVSDTGSGIPEEIQDKIFEPFFTTKPVGYGTGLGLSMVYGIVQNHGAEIFCESRPGCGTRFHIYFPAVQERPREDKTVSTSPKQKPGKGVILLVDDEELIREFGREMLEFCGYDVVTACSGEEAVELFRKDPHAFDVVILDLIMPGMGGARCLEKLLELRPETKVIVASGFSGRDSAQETLQRGAFDFVGKPYQMDTLLNKIQRAFQ